MKCLKLCQDDISDVWPCDNCRHVAKDVRSLNDKFDKRLDIVESLSKSIEENNKDEAFLQMQYTQLKDEHCILKQQNEKLNTEVGEVKRRLNTNYAVPDKSGKNLLLESSLVRNFDKNKLKDTDVICLRGAKVCDLHNELRGIKDSDKEYQRVILLLGGNDASQNSQDINLDNVTSHFKSMVETAVTSMLWPFHPDLNRPMHWKHCCAKCQPGNVGTAMSSEVYW